MDAHSAGSPSHMLLYDSVLLPHNLFFLRQLVCTSFENKSIMKSFTTVAAAAGLASMASAMHCHNMTVPVTISARNGKYDQQMLTPEDNIDVTNFILRLSRQGTNYSMEALEGVRHPCDVRNGSANCIFDSTKQSRGPTTWPRPTVLRTRDTQTLFKASDSKRRVLGNLRSYNVFVTQ